ncbi:hypothetical protein ACFVX6_14075 [Streptomyces sp. NPDC058289]|uniref:hypothetical protein n=1 Tax=Streptomyces sp. NPDC058289 TaxID=3346425 RepID=UPI0036F0E6E7
MRLNFRALPNPRALLSRLPFRVRLAMAFSGRFLLSGILLLAFVVLLARYGTAQQVQGISVTYGDMPSGQATPRGPVEPVHPTRPDGRPEPPSDVAMLQKIGRPVQAVQDTALRQMVLWSAVDLLVMAVIAGHSAGGRPDGHCVPSSP